MKKVFFTGSQGLLGARLKEVLQSKGDFAITEFSGRIENYQDLKTAFQSDEWDYVFHFAGISHVGECENDPQKAYEVNSLGTLLLSQILSSSAFSGRLFFASTSQVYDYDLSSDRVEINENSKVIPKNIYSKTKFYSEKILEGLSATSNVQVSILRLFNHTHRSQSPKFILPSVHQQIMSSKDGDQIRVGNIDVYRDFSLVSEFTDRFLEILNKNNSEKFQVINLSSGVPRSVRNIVKLLIEKSGKSLEIVTDPTLIRRNDPTYIVGKFTTSYTSNFSDEQFVTKFLAN